MVTVTPEAMVMLVAICWPLLQVVSAEMVVPLPASLASPPLEPLPELVPPPPLLLPLLDPAVPPLDPLEVPLLLPEGSHRLDGGVVEPAEEHPARTRTPGTMASMKETLADLSDSAWKNMRQTPRAG
jgi:hypothetical protein